jgi:hypothetical protein
MPPLANLDAFSRWGRASLFLWYHTCLCHKPWYHRSKPRGNCNFRIAGALPIQSIAAAEVDPIFALIAAHQKAYEDLNAAENAHSAVEQELQAAGDLFPSVTSRGNPSSGLPWGVWTGPHGDAECGASDSSVLSAFGPHVRATLGDQSQIGIGT